VADFISGTSGKRSRAADSLAALSMIGFIYHPLLPERLGIGPAVLPGGQRSLPRSARVTRIKSKVNEGMLTELDTDFLQIGCLQDPCRRFSAY
jgi:hypothetical protein